MCNSQTGDEGMPHDLIHLGVLAGKIGRFITLATTTVNTNTSSEMDAVSAVRLSPLRRGLEMETTVENYTL